MILNKLSSILSDEISKLEIQRGLDAELEEVVNSSDKELR